ncbi:MAG: response regulator [Armatimonadetes bacterium]|nr:response regulator [Armatimonadota bacterium]
MSDNLAKAILIVDDNPTNRKLLRMVLAAEGYRIYEASHGVEALTLLEQHPVDAVVSDILMPYMDGFRLCVAVRKSGRFGRLPFVVYTCTYTSPGDERLAYQLGADKYIRRPGPARVILEAVNELCVRPRVAGPIRAEEYAEPGVTKAYSEALVKKLEERNAELARTASHQESLVGISHLALASADLGTLVDEVVRLVTQTLNVEYCGYWEVVPAEQRLLLQAGTGWKAGVVGQATVSAIASDSQAAYTLQADRPVVVEQFPTEQRFHGAPLLSDHGVCSGLSAGIHGTHAGLGVLSIHTATTRHFEPDEVLFLQSAANVLAAAIDRFQAEEDLSAAKRSAEEAMSAAQEANQAKDRFLAVLSHELRTPLTPVLALVSRLQKSPSLSEEMQANLDLIRRNVEMEARLIDDLLDLTRIIQGKILLDKRAVDLAPILHRAVEVCWPDAQARGLQVSTELGDTPCLIEADPARIEQVFWNLIANAVKFTERGGVRIRCFTEDGWAVTEVKDRGRGIEPQALGRIFDAFAQADPAVVRQFGGLGLGLFISKSVVEMHGGTIEAQSAGRDQGATFRVRLPLMPAQAPRASPGIGRIEDAGADRQAGCLRLLVVEDHPDSLEMLRLLLELQGYEVQTAGSLAAALEAAGRQGFDFLISDLGLPDGSGHDLMRELRSRGHKMPGVALSGFGQESDIEQSLSAGFAAHLTKPVDMDGLVAAIEKVVART